MNYSCEKKPLTPVKSFKAMERGAPYALLIPERKDPFLLGTKRTLKLGSSTLYCHNPHEGNLNP